MDLKNISDHSHRDHAFLSPSKYHWIRYDKEKLVKAFYNYMAVEKGTKLHEIAESLIRERIRLPKSSNTLNMFVNDAIRFKMEPEKLLKYSDNLYGTTDAISFNNNLLRIHDLKTGTTIAHMDQLMIYAGLYCLINHINPMDINIELRIYQNDDIKITEPEPLEIQDYMDRMVAADQIVKEIREQEEYYVY